MLIDENKYLNELNNKQKQAVLHSDGAVYVVAGAGTGKTKTLTTRILHLINSGINPESILAVTFTNKAAREMRERIESYIGEDVRKANLFTFHSFAAKVLRKHVNSLGNRLNRSFAILDDDDSNKILKESMKEAFKETFHFFEKESWDDLEGLRVSLSEISTKIAKTEISKYKNLEKTKMGFLPYEVYYYKVLLSIYQKKLLLNNAMDFDDLLVFLHKLLSENPTVRSYYRAKFEHILVDEFQDTNILQYEILKLLVNDKVNIFVVGDPDQSIYAFRGARYENNVLFITDFEAKKIVLDKNYRSTNKILKSANRLIAFNNDRTGQKDLKSDLGDGDDIVFKKFFESDQETKFVVSEIKNLIKSGIKPSEIAVLYRNNHLSRSFEENLLRNGINYMIYGGLSFFERKEVKDILAYLRVILDYSQLFYLKRIINVPKRKIGLATVEKVETIMEETSLNFFDAYKKTKLSKATTEMIAKFENSIDYLKNFLEDEDNDISSFYKRLLDEIQYEEYLNKTEDDEVAKDKFQNVEELLNVLINGFNYYQGTNVGRLQQVLDEISLMTDKDKNSTLDDQVILSTYHQVKGLEFKVVFMVAMEDSIFPNVARLSHPRELEEERRIAYVGVTRAKERLYMTSADYRMIFGRQTMSGVSQFVYEALEEHDIY